MEQAPARTCGPTERGAHAGEGSLAGLVALWWTHTGAGAEGEESSPEEEGAAETRCDELTVTPIPHPL